MASFTAGTTFQNNVAGDVTAAKLDALISAATPTSGFIQDRTSESAIAADDTLLFGDFSDSSNLKRITVANFAGTLPTATITSGTITTLNSTTGTITTGVIPTLTSTTLITTGTGTAASPAIVPTGDTNTGIFFPAADTIAFSEGGAEAMRIDSSGNVGIGTSPAFALNVKGPASEYRTALFETSSTNGPSVQIKGSKTYELRSTGTGATEGGGLFFIYDKDNEASRITVGSTGNVGIGTSSPTHRLDVNGVVACTANSNGSLPTATSGLAIAQNYGGGAAGSAEVDFIFNSATFAGDNGGFRFYQRTGASTAQEMLRLTQNTVIAYTGGTERLRIDSNGNVGIGTSSPSAQLELSTDSAKKPSTNTWTIASDQRLKTNITNADNDRCYEIVKQVPLKRYTWKNEVYSQDKVKDRSKLGWIAQDVEAVFPKAVGTNRFAYNQVFEDVVTPELDSDGNAVLDENGVAKTKTEKRLVSEEVIEDCKDLNSDQIYAAMYGTIQKLIEKVEFLESKVAILEAA